MAISNKHWRSNNPAIAELWDRYCFAVILLCADAAEDLEAVRPAKRLYHMASRFDGDRELMRAAALNVHDVSLLTTCGGHRDIQWEPRSAAKKTESRPGSIEKIRVMRKRAARGEAIIHPDDTNVIARTASREECFRFARRKNKALTGV